MTKWPDLEPLLHEVQAAKILGISAAWLQRHRWAGTGPAYVRVGGRMGRAVRYRTSDLVRWIEENRIDPQLAKTKSGA